MGRRSSLRRKQLSTARPVRPPEGKPAVIAPIPYASGAPFLLALFFSGASGLVYEITWMRRLTHVFGSSTLAVSTVLAAFMGGLALGSFLFGRIVDRRPQSALLLYGLLEIGIGLLALSMPLLFQVAGATYLGLYPPLEDLPWLFFVVQFVLVGAAILLPTLLMGGTLPVLVRGLVARLEDLSQRSGSLYAANTLGAGAGAAITTYSLLPTLGVFRTELVAVVLNIAVGAAVLLAFRGRREPGEAAAAARAAGDAEEVAAPLSPRTRTLLLGTALLGFSAMVYEVAWSRLLALVLGSSVYAFGTMLLVFLLGLSIGSALFSRLHPRHAPLVFVLSAAANCVCGLIGILLVPHLPAIFLTELARVRDSFLLQQLHQVFVGALLVLPCAVLFGLAFPAVITGATDALRAAGRGVGRVTAYNTVGTVVGAFLAGFVLVPALGLRATLTVGLMTTAGAALLALSLVPATLPTLQRGVVSGVAVTLLLSVLAPSWPHEILLSGAAYFGGLGATPEEFLAGARDSKLLFYEDGIATSISVDEKNGIRLYRSNGKTDASSDPGDMANQLLLGHIPMLLHPDPKEVFILGMGTGVTAAAVARYPVTSIEIVDIEPASRRAAAYFEPENRRVVADPRTHFIAADGRNALLARGKNYDVIISDPSDVWVAGVGNLFTREFYELAREHLRKDGVMVQWFHMHALQPENMKLIVATFRSVFPDASFWRPNRGDIILVGTKDGVPWDYARLRARFENVAGVKDDMMSAGLWHPLTLFAAFVLDGAELDAMLSEIRTLHTDERPVIEFEAPRALYADTTATVDPMVQTFQRKDYPSLANFDEKELTARDIYLFGFGYASLKRPDPAIRLMEESIRRDPEGDPKFRVGLANQYRAQGNHQKARELYESALRRAPGDAEAALALAALHEEAGQPDAAIDVLKRAVAATPDDIDLLRAAGRLLHSRNRPSEALPFLARVASGAASDAGSRAAYGKALVAAGRTAEGIAELQAARALDPTLPGVPPAAR